MVRFKILVLFLIMTSRLFAEGFDSSYVKQFDHKLTLKGDLSSKTLSFSLMSAVPDSTSRTVNYLPNVNSSFGFGFSYKFISISISFKIPKSDSLMIKRGSTKYTDIQMSIYKRKFFFNAGFKTYKGFYISNPQDIYQGWSDSLPNPHRADLEYDAIGLQACYLLNGKKYSLKSSFNYTEQQQKSASSFMLLGDLSYIGVKGDSCIIPPSQNSSYGNLKGLSKVEFLSFVVSAGFTYNFIIQKKIFINPMLFSGIGTQLRGFQADSSSITTTSMFGLLNFKLSTGYNGNRFYIGFVFDALNYLMNAKEINFSSKNTYYTLNLGVRLF
ncbi:MAG: DUF4421 family protein [Bacteroidetes bacterium]|nr:DUF4421 family protein [Bacteroidota bacterium]